MKLFLLLSIFSTFFTSVQADELREDLRPFLIRIEPMALMFGIPGASFEVGISRRLMLGVGFQYFEASNRSRNLQVREYSWLTSIYPFQDRSQNAWVIQPAVRYFDNDDHSNTGRGSASQQGLYLTTTGGYEWVWQSGWHVCLGAGISVGLDSFSRREVDPLIDWRVGWAF